LKFISIEKYFPRNPFSKWLCLRGFFSRAIHSLYLSLCIFIVFIFQRAMLRAFGSFLFLFPQFRASFKICSWFRHMLLLLYALECSSIWYCWGINFQEPLGECIAK
jgi:hypothetical protein